MNGFKGDVHIYDKDTGSAISVNSHIPTYARTICDLLNRASASHADAKEGE